MEPSLLFGDAPCPACGSLLWFVRLGDKNVLVKPTDEAKRKGIRYVLCEITGLTESELEDPEAVGSLELDSMDLVEMVMRLEDQAEGQGDKYLEE